MKSTTTITAIFHCPLELAFRIPLLGDARNIHTGFGWMPLVTHFTEDENWGRENGSRKVFIKKNLLFKEGLWATDISVKRVENQYWKWELTDFQQNRYGIAHMEAEWFVEEIAKNEILVRYVYHLSPTTVLFQPFIWLFTITVWRMYMKHAMENIKGMAERGDELVYE